MTGIVTNRVLNLSRWAVVTSNDMSGVGGRLAGDIQAILGLQHLVIPSECLETQTGSSRSETLLSRNPDEAELSAALQGLQGLVVLGSPGNKRLLPAARRLGVRVTCVPLRACFQMADADWDMVDLFLCPSDFCLRVVRGRGLRNSIQVPWTVDLSRLPSRNVRGKARVFFHNCEFANPEARSRTRDTIAAFKRVRRRDVRLIVSLQEPVNLGPLDDRVELRIRNLEDASALYTDGDVAVQLSSLEGIGFMVLEPVCCGVPTITTNCPPGSDYVIQPELRTKTRWFSRPVLSMRATSHPQPQLGPPSINDVTRRLEWCADHDLTSISTENRIMAQRMFNPDVLRARWTHVLSTLM